MALSATNNVSKGFQFKFPTKHQMYIIIALCFRSNGNPVVGWTAFHMDDGHILIIIVED